MSLIPSSADAVPGVLALAEAFRSGERSSEDVVEASLRRIEALNETLGAFYFVDADGARAQARASRERWRQGLSRGSLDGVPVAIKDNIFTAGMPSYWGAAGTSSAPPPIESCVVTRLREAGAVILGKTTMAEMGFYAGDVSSRYRGARNPWNPEHTAGGSSGGSAAAVAAGLCAAAIGTDGAGSVRMPASFCGLVGIKPSGGRVPVLPSPGQNPVVGPIARSVADAAAILQVIAQPDPRDHNAVPFAADDFAAALRRDVKGMKIGYLPEIGYGETPRDTIARAVRSVVEGLADCGAGIEERAPIFSADLAGEILDGDLPYLCHLVEMLVGGHTAQLLPTTRQALDYGRTISLAAHMRAVRRTAAAVQEFCAALRPFDVLITPTMPRTAFAAGVPFPPELRPNCFGYAFDFAAFVHIANLAALPAGTIPCGLDESGLPIGLQIIGKRYREADVLRVANACERIASFADARTLATERLT